MGEQGLGMSRLYSLPWRRKQNSNINVDTKRLHTATASACHNAYAMPISYRMKQSKRQKSLRIQVRSQRDWEWCLQQREPWKIAIISTSQTPVPHAASDPHSKASSASSPSISCTGDSHKHHAAETVDNRQWPPETCAAELLNDLVFACPQTQMLHEGLIDCVCKTLAELLLSLVHAHVRRFQIWVSLEVYTILPSALAIWPRTAAAKMKGTETSLSWKLHISPQKWLQRAMIWICQ